MWQNKDQEASDLDKDLREQTIKLERAQKQLHKTMREIKGTRQSQPIPFYLVSLHFHILNSLHHLGIRVNMYFSNENSWLSALMIKSIQ